MQTINHKVIMKNLSLTVIPLVFTICLTNCGNIKKDSNLAFTNRVLLIDLNDNNGVTLDLDTLFAKSINQVNDKLCFLDPITNKAQVVTSKDQIPKNIFFNDILLIRVIGRNKYVNIIDDVKRKIVVQFRRPNKNSLMANATLHKFQTGRPEQMSSLGSSEVDANNPDALMMSYIESVLKLGVRDPVI
jgi:hypothetical protein